MANKKKVITADFNKMQQIYGAIRRLDNIDMTKDPVDIIEQTMCCIKDIEQNDFSDEMIANFVNNIRNGLVEIYENMSQQINGQIIKPKEPVMRGSVIVNTQYNNEGNETDAEGSR